MAPQFEFTAKNKKGEMIKDNLEAESKSVLASQIRDRGYFITEIKEKKKRKTVSEIFDSYKRVKIKDLAVFSQQFSAMINAGISIVEALNIITRQTEHPKLKGVLDEVQNDVETGVSLADAMAKHPNVFPELYVQLIRAGETGGVLDGILNKLAAHYERQDELNGMVKSALYYPLVIFIVGIAVVVFLMLNVVPQFVTMFQDFGTELPLPTRMLLGLSSFMQNYWWLLMAAALIGFYVLYKYYKTPEGKIRADKLLLKIPVVGKMMEKVYVSRFSSTLAILLDSGVDLLSSLEIVEDVVSNKVYADILSDSRVRVREGSTLSEPLQKSKRFPAMVVHMLKVGEETGSMGQMLTKVSDFYDRQVESAVEAAISLIEPLMIVFLAVMVGFVAISIVTPMFDMFQQF